MQLFKTQPFPKSVKDEISRRVGGYVNEAAMELELEDLKWGFERHSIAEDTYVFYCEDSNIYECALFHFPAMKHGEV